MSKITKSARGQDCQVRIPFVCNHDNSTTVLAHLGGAGLAIKHPDFLGAYACSNCHAAIDGHIKTDYSKDELKLMHLEGIARTQLILFDSGLIIIN